MSVCLKTRMKSCSCALVALLACTAAAEIIHEVVEEQTSVSLRCPHSVEGTVTWSRENNGREVKILTVDVDSDIRQVKDPQKRYSSLSDKSLSIRRVTASDSGRYFCNREAVELTVIPPGTTTRDATEGTEVTLTCPPDAGGPFNKRWSSNNTGDINTQTGFYVSPVDQMLTITSVELKHSGLYFCEGKPAAYLKVTKGYTTTTTTPPTTRQTTTTVPSTTRPTNEVPDLVIGIVAFLLLLIIIIVVYFALRRRIKRRGSAERSPVYDEIRDSSAVPPTNGGGSLAGPTAIYCMADDFPDVLHHNDHTYSTIPDLPPVGKKSETSLPDNSTCSFIGNPFIGEINNGPSQLPDNIYFLLEKPKAPGNNTDQHL
ncbi:uncharacterized protein LOC117739316 isoform X10 [Cyclopterus lumpus]|uniref:uncharacterized protein LOC117739316 isoform X10 n=1 Tax=Cyclopterus lumpus TaxID=8103 RepID=UPI001486BC00|nr:uncharacterized protein LOC117739316 isoform X10 [Cyclopterus lumpus]